MSDLTFILKEKPKFTLDMSPIIPEKLSGLNQTKIKKIKLIYGKESLDVGELFEISGKAGECISIEKSCDKLICVGKNMKKGSITIKGNVGDLLGQSMNRGTITVKGNAGSWVGTAMTGGEITVIGNVGNFE